ncbi:MAG: class II aldolase/adducin family protein [Bacteriovoracaceae bacterium]|nr:class II aldolase/adducin family protein [Bacteriovoracaceae bacterium]
MKHKEPPKFNYQIKKTSGPENHIIHSLEKWRVLFHKIKLLGESPIDKLSYGELSRRDVTDSEHFIITGEQTGGLPNLKREHYTKITEVDVKKMKILVEGSVAPPEHVFVHYAIYQALENIKFIFHIHQPQIRKTLFKNKDYPVVKLEQKRANDFLKEVESETKDQTNNIVLVHELPDSVFILGDDENVLGKFVLELNKKHQVKSSDN